MKKTDKCFVLFVLLSFFVACQNKTQSDNKGDVKSNIEIKYAVGFSVDVYDNYKHITVKNTLNNSQQQHIYLVKNDSVKVPDDGVKVVVPITKLAAASVTYYGMLEELGEINSVKGACSPQIAYDQNIIKNLENGELADLGDLFSLNTEKLFMLQPDIFMLPYYNNQEELTNRLVQFGIKPVFNNEWLEKTPLGKAEWIKFVALFYEKEAIADSIFDKIEERYNEALELAKGAKESPKVLLGNSFKGTWYMPGGNSFMAKMLQDANCEYVYKNDTTTASIPRTFEVILNDFHDADIWLNVNAHSIDELLAMDERHELFNPVKTGNVFALNKRYLPSSANDYWERGVIEPDVILKDMIWALHPYLLPNYQSIYLTKLTKQ